MAHTNDADHVDVNELIDRACTEAVRSLQNFTALVGEVDGFDEAFLEATANLYASFGDLDKADEPYHRFLAGGAVGYQFGLLMARKLATAAGGAR